MLKEIHITATEAVRKFSELLNSAKYKGEKFMVIRGGKPVAVIRPLDSSDKAKSLADLVEVLKDLPKLGDEAESFDRDLRKIFQNQPFLPKKSPWD